MSHPAGARFDRLVEIMHLLRGPDGCPWDREQTLETLRSYLVEETYEVLEAMETGTTADHREELGDLMFQIVFQSAIRQREGAFTVDDVIRGIADKLRRRHPHVFGDGKLETSAQVLDQWNKLKEKEKPRPTKVKVKGKETLVDIARQWNTTPAAIMMENNLTSDRVQPGQVLKLPPEKKPR